VAGTPLYMAPEQARGEAVDARADLFSLGSVLYAMSTGRPPFEGKTPFNVLRQVTEDVPRDVREFNAKIPDWLVAVIERLHAKNPADRFQSAAQVAEVLGHYHAQVQVSSGSSVRVVGCPSAARRRVLWRGVLAAVAVLLGV